MTGHRLVQSIGDGGQLPLVSSPKARCESTGVFNSAALLDFQYDRNRATTVTMTSQHLRRIWNMDTQEGGTKEFSNNKVVGASVLAPAEPGQPATRTNSSKPRKKKVANRPKLASRKTSVQEKLVCRYCGSDDLAPSFKKRRDARCRACFKKRYSSAATGKNTRNTQKTKKTKRTRAAKAAG
jgi:hypothetical protein